MKELEGKNVSIIVKLSNHMINQGGPQKIEGLLERVDDEFCVITSKKYTAMIRLSDISIIYYNDPHI